MSKATSAWTAARWGARPAGLPTAQPAPRTGSGTRSTASARLTPIEARSDAEAIGTGLADPGRYRGLRAARRVLELLADVHRRGPVAAVDADGCTAQRIEQFAGSLDEKPAAELTVADVRAGCRARGAAQAERLAVLPELDRTASARRCGRCSSGRPLTAVSANPFAELDRDDSISRVDPGMPRTITLEQADAARRGRRRAGLPGADPLRGPLGAPLRRAARVALGGRRPARPAAIS